MYQSVSSFNGKKMSPCGKTRIGNDIHFHLEGHIVVQTEVLQPTTGIKSVLMADMVVLKYSRSPPFFFF